MVHARMLAGDPWNHAIWSENAVNLAAMGANPTPLDSNRFNALRVASKTVTS